MAQLKSSVQASLDTKIQADVNGELIQNLAGAAAQVALGRTSSRKRADGSWDGVSIKLPNGYDLHLWADDLVSGQVYNVLHPVNAPSSGWWYVEILRHYNDTVGNQYRTLRITAMVSTAYPNGTIFTATSAGGTWSAWEQLGYKKRAAYYHGGSTVIPANTWTIVPVDTAFALTSQDATNDGTSIVIPKAGAYQVNMSLYAPVGAANLTLSLAVGVNSSVTEAVNFQFSSYRSLFNFTPVVRSFNKNDTVQLYVHTGNSTQTIPTNHQTNLAITEI